MEHHQAGMAYKWERHFNGTRTSISYALVVIGMCFAIPLLILYPQVFNVDVFNARLAYQLVLSEDRYFTCSEEFHSFILDEPDASLALYSFYLFNVTNAPNVFQRGDQPEIFEVGPYAYQKRTYKYDVTFDPTDSSTVSFKEYILLDPVTDPSVCVKMYHILEKDFQAFSDPCATGACECQNPSQPVFVVNPLFMKLIWQESPQELIARYSSAVFFNIKNLLLGEFVTAVKMHLVRIAYQEIFFFRQQLQIGPLLKHGWKYLRYNYTSSVLTNQQLSDMMLSTPSKIPSFCGLNAFGLTGCPFDVSSSLEILRGRTSFPANFSKTDYPSLATFFDSSSPLYLFEFTQSLPKLFGSLFCLGVSNFNANSGYTMLTDAECTDLADFVVNNLARKSFGVRPTTNQLFGSRLMAKAFFMMIRNWVNNYGDYLYDQTYLEWKTTFQPVTCSPLGVQCVWQWGYMAKYHGNNAPLSTDLIYTLIDYRASGNTNPNSFIFDGNSGPKYNAYKYCSIVRANPNNYDKCLNISYTFNDGMRYQPAALWGVDNGVTAINRTRLYSDFSRQLESVRESYIEMSCNLTTLMFEIYPQMTEYHDNFVIRYLNRKKDPAFTHDFVVGQWDDIGYAQWGGGFVTWAIVGVRSIVQVNRNGMWVIGEADYITELVEYSSWCLYNAYPQAWLYNVTDSRILLTALSRKDEAGVTFKKHIVTKATTFVGTGSNFVNGVGAVGEITFTTQQNLAEYNCTGELEAACNVLALFYSSSSASCNAVQSTYDYCLAQRYSGNSWVTQCDRFETAITNPTGGVQCDNQMVYLHLHPYVASRGTITYSMLLQLTLLLILQRGLWCSNFNNCLFNLGGLFVTTTAKAVLFEGYTDPSVLQFLNLKHESDNIRFSCAQGSVDGCGKSNLKCDRHGVVMSLPNNKQMLLEYNSTPHDQYFAPYFEVASDGDLLWRFAMDPAVAAASQERFAHEDVVRVFNPFWAAHPAWPSGDVAFNKYLQCQKRYFGGMSSTYRSCEDTLNTGTVELNKTLDIKVFMGNDTIDYFGAKFPVNGSTFPRMQTTMYMWNGFASYPYTYFLKDSQFFTMESTSIFDKKYGLWFPLSQKPLLFNFERNIELSFPVRNTFVRDSYPISLTSHVRRFVEDQTSWEPYNKYGTPHDSYGMPYKVPIGMASLERISSFPLFLGTAHSWGNKLWGGLEFGDVEGYSPDVRTQRTYVDYEPVTGRILRAAHRQQILIRIERGPLTPNIISSQKRCSVPTKSFNGYSGYGCFAYVPLYWTEESVVLPAEEYFKLNDHFFTRPVRAATITYIGVSFGVAFVLVGIGLYIHEQFKRKKFMTRVYIDG